MVDCKATSIEQFWPQLKAKNGAKNLAIALENQFKDWFACMSPAANEQRPLGARWNQLQEWISYKFASNTNPITTRACLECVKALQRAQESMAALELASAPDALSIALLLCADISVPDPSDAQNVDTVGWLETLFEPCKKFVLTGVFEGSLPSAAQVDGWFNESIRAAIGLPTRGARFARDAYLLSALVARAHVANVNAAHMGASGLAIIAGQLGGDGEPLKPSRLLLPKDEIAIAHRILLLLPHDADGVAIKRMRPAPKNSPATFSAFALKPQPRGENKNEMPRAISVTDFAVHIDNPYRYWLEKVLKLSAPELDQVELNAAEFGTLLHAAAQALDGDAIKLLDCNHANYEAQCVQTIMQVARERAQTKYGGDLTLSIRLALLELQNRLPALVTWHAAQLRAGWRVVATEWPRAQDDALATLDVDGSPQIIKFRVDRIDFHDQRGWRIIDYKSSDGGFSIKDKVLRGGKWIDLQLPLYKFLLPQIAAQHAELAGLASATSDKIEVGVLSVPASNMEPVWCPLLEPIDTAVEQAKRIVREIRAGTFPDTGRDPSRKFDRVRRALCLPIFDQESAQEEAAEGVAT